jgi:hypothetical protein
MGGACLLCMCLQEPDCWFVCAVGAAWAALEWPSSPCSSEDAGGPYTPLSTGIDTGHTGVLCVRGRDL